MKEFLKDDAFMELRARMSGIFDALDSVKIGSLFSGWGVAEMVIHELERLWNGHGTQLFQMKA